MLKKLALIIIFLLPAIGAQAYTATINSLTNITSFNGTCDVGDVISFQMTGTAAATVNDLGGFDWIATIVYDGYGTPINVAVGSAPVGASYTMTTGFFNIQTSPAARPFTLKAFDIIDFHAAGAETYPLLVSVTFDPGDYGVCSSLPDVAPVTTSSDSPPHFTDGRLNNFDMAAPFVVYGHDYEDGRGLVVYSPTGDLLLTVTAEELGECAGETVLLKSGNGIWVYRLDTCEYQMMAASLDGTKTYVLIFNEPYPNTSYSSHEE